MSDVDFQPRRSCELRGEPWSSCEAHLFRVTRTRDFESGLGDFDIVRCRRCDLGFTEPYPTEETAGALYETKSSGDFDVIQETPIDRLKDHLARRLMREVARGRRVGAVLDYGTGNGRFAVAAAAEFPEAQVDALDYQPTPPPLLAAGVPRVRYVRPAVLDEVSGLYDLIFLRHVLEHTHHPVDLVRRLGDALAPDGVLYIEVPNLDAGCARVFGAKWKGYYVPRHIFHYTAESLAEIVRLAGLEAEIGRNEMPLMGNMISILTGADKSSPFVQALGVALHPAQLLIEAVGRSSTCLNARCRRPASLGSA